MCEKPLAYKMEDEKELVKLSKTTDKICTVNLYLRNAWYTKEMKEFISSGEIGDVRLYRITFGFPRRDARDFRYNKALGGGALLDAGGYTMKYATTLLGLSG